MPTWSLGAESTWSGKVRVDGRRRTAYRTGYFASSRAGRTRRRTRSASVGRKRRVHLPFVPDETYDLYVLNAPNDYLKSVRVANAERLGQGLEASPAAPTGLGRGLGAAGGQVPEEP